MKTCFIWFGLLLKRTIKKPAFLLFLLSMPLLSFMIDRLGQGEGAGTTVGICLEGTEAEAFFSLLQEQEGVLRFRLYESENKMRQDVEKSELDCGVFLHEELWEGLSAGAWQNTITVYTTSSSSMTNIVKEKIASIVFTLYSERAFGDYIERSEIFAGAEGTDGGADVAAFAKAAYETHLLDGSTFAFRYQGNPGGNQNGSAADISGPSAFRLRGILAVCIFLSGMSGLLTDWKDREERRFGRLIPPAVTTMVNIWIPTIYTSAAVLFSLWLTGNMTVSGSGGNPAAGLFGGLGKELAGLLFYQFLIVMYCSIIRIVLRKQEMIAAAIPLLTLCTGVCCPVWIRLAAYVPLFRVLEKLFPATYYLLL